jgi:hypothetical protein
MRMAALELAHDLRRQRQDAERELRMVKRQHERMLCDDMYMVLRAGLFAEAEAALLQRLDESGSRSFDMVRDAKGTTPLADVALWIDEVIGAAAIDPKGGPLTAIEIDLSNAGVHRGGPSEPRIEVTGYTDQFFPFSRASDDEIANAQLGVATPWQGAFDWFPEGAYALDGLGEINRALLTYKHGPREEMVWVRDQLAITPDAKAEPVASLLMAVKFHRFIRDAVTRVAVPEPLVVVADGNDEIYVRALHHRPPVG